MNSQQGGHVLNNLIIRASAGTGKTFRLSNRYLALLHRGVSLDQILATTFTRKAAGEILDRVISRLAEAATDDRRLAELATSIQDESLDRDSCLTMLEQTMRMLHRLRVSTLDSFFSQIARSHGLELGFPSGWQIVDELFDARLRSQAIDAVLSSGDSQRLRTLVYLLTKGEATRSVGRLIHEAVDGLYGLFLQTDQKAWEAVPQYKALDAQELADTLEDLRCCALDGKRLVRARDEDYDRAIEGDWETFLAKGLAAKVAAGQYEYYRKTIPDDAVACYRRLIDHVKALLVGRLALQTKATYELLQLFDVQYQRLKDHHRVLRFEDVTRRLGGKPDAVDERALAFRLDSQINHLLLDEFQDTSPLQWRVVRPLAERATGGQERTFFCVGDVKQSIYGWRGGVPEIFDAIEQQLPGLEQESLNVSYRSSQPVIDVVNQIFSRLDQHPNLNRAQRSVDRWCERFQTHKTARRELEGYVELLAAPEAEEGEQQRDATARFTADRIAELVRRYPGCSVGVLVRKNETVAKLIYELRKQSVEASEEGGNPLTDSAAVTVILSLLRLADHPGDTVARFHLAHSPLGPDLGLQDHKDDYAARRLAQQVRQWLLADGYGPTLYGWAQRLAPHCNRRELSRLEQLVKMAYAYEKTATLRTDNFVAYVEKTRVADPTAADVRVMTIHQSKGLQFDIVVLPELDANLVGQPDPVVIDRPDVAGPAQRVCRYAGADVRQLLPDSFQRMFDEATDRRVTESLCVLYVAVTRAIHGLHMIIPPSAPNERSLPCTFAGLVRAALRDAERAEADTQLFCHGNPKWAPSGRSVDAAKETPDAAAATSPKEPVSIRLAEMRDGPARGWERARPSGLEGGSHVPIESVLAASRSAAFVQGELIHAWFEQIQWLDDGVPQQPVLERVARQVLAGGGAGSLNVGQQISRFREMLDRPLVAQLLSRARYQQFDDLGLAPAIRRELADCVPTPIVQNERGFAIRESGRLLNGFIDRLVLLQHGGRIVAAEVIDYKTDALDATNSKQIAEKTAFYAPQLEAYRQAVAHLTGLPSERIGATLAFVAVGVNQSV